jgi:pimeloyl-ACP methyl ester carboxylesterase
MEPVRRSGRPGRGSFLMTTMPNEPDRRTLNQRLFAFSPDCVPRSVACNLRFLAFFFLFSSFSPAELPATELTLKDGRIIKGGIGKVVSLAENPKRPRREGEVPLIVLVDDELRRTFIPLNSVQEVREGDAVQIGDKFHLPQQVKHFGPTIRPLGPMLREWPFDAHGHRRFTMYAQHGPEDVFQGITELTPWYFKAEGLSHVLDMRIATSSLPSDTLEAILWNQSGPNKVEHAKRVAWFFLLAERFEVAQRTLENLLKANPGDADLKEKVEPEIRRIRQLSADKLKKELELRRKAGQHRLVYGMMQRFPTEGVAGEILQGVREMIQDYDAKIARRTKILEQFGRLIPQVKSTPQRMLLEKIRGEIAEELSVDTLDRFAAFVQDYDDAEMTAEEKLAMAVSGWLLGKDAATAKLPVALSAYSVRGKIRRYVSEPIKLTRAQIFSEFAAEEAAAPSYAVKILSNMKPPQEAPPPVSRDMPGFFRLETPGLPDQPSMAYWVQLPPEYDPYRAYPTIVTLHGEGDSAEKQVAWWAGDWNSPPGVKKKPNGDHQIPADGNKRPTTSDKPPAIPQGSPKASGKGIGPQPIPSTAAGSDRGEESDSPHPSPLPKGEGTGGDASAVKRPAAPRYRTGHAARRGYIVIAPEWTEEHQRQYNYSAREHAAVVCALRDACRRFAVDTDRVYLSGRSMGGDAAWDIGLAHPDLWAGVIPISAQADKFCNFYAQNARYVPFYVVLGELDDDKMVQNALQLDHYLRHNFPVTVVEFQGRGHEDFYDEILNLFDWMGQYRRNFYPKQFTCSTLRDTDSFFWWIEIAGLPSKTRIDPASWPPPTGTLPFQLSGTITPGNTLYATARAGRVRVWISPQMIDFQQKASVTVNGRRINAKEPFIRGDLQTLLEDVRTRGDRQHPFWAMFE